MEKYLNELYCNKVLNDNDYTKNVKVTINENRAPTDDSIRIYDEMFNKVLGRIVDAQVSNNNEFSYSYLIYEVMPSNSMIKSLEIIFKVKINGKQYEINKRIPDLIIQEAKPVEENGVLKIKYKFDENELYIFRLKMLVDIIIKEMYNLDEDNFNKLISSLK